MQRFAFYTLFSSLVLAGTSCQRADVAPTEKASPATGSGIVGEWNWVESVGGLTGRQTDTPTSTNRTRKWVFKADSTVQVYTTYQGTTPPAATGTYSLGTARSIYSGQVARALVLRFTAVPPAQSYQQTFLVQAVGSRLVVADNNPDGFTDTYQRQ